MIARPTKLPIDPAGTPDRGYATCRVTSPYGPRDGGFHAANDIGNGRLGDIIIASEKGLVVAAGYLSYPWSEPKPSDAQWASWGYPANRRPSLWQGPTWGGLMVIIRTANHYLLYAHCQTVSVKAGDKVGRGQAIATIGESGSAYHAGHLHFGVVVTTEAYLAQLAAAKRPLPRSVTRDPWPLYSATASLPEIPLEEDDMLPDNMRPLATVVIGEGNNLRKSPSTDAEKFYLEPGTGSRTLMLLGYVKGGPWTLAGVQGNDWAIVKGDETWYIARPLAPTPSLTVEAPAPPVGFTQADLDAAQAVGRAGGIEDAVEAVSTLK